MGPFQLFDLAPILDCMQLPTPGEQEMCMEAAEPWLRITMDGGIRLSDGAIKGIAGGAIGVLGTVGVALTRKKEVKDRLKCMYCDGTGQITCGRCLGTGVRRFTNSDGVDMTEVCPNCEGKGTIMCINCQGSGRSVPDDIFDRLGDEEQGFTEEDYIGIFDAMAEKKQHHDDDDVIAAEAIKKYASTAAAKSPELEDVPRPVDFTDGLG